MEIELRALLQASAAVMAAAPGGVHWGARPQGGALPALVLHRIGGGFGATLTGSDGLDAGRVQADAVADDLDGALALQRAAVAALHGYRGGGFRGVFEESRRDGREGGSNEAERPYLATVDFLVNWSDAT